MSMKLAKNTSFQPIVLASYKLNKFDIKMPDT